MSDVLYNSLLENNDLLLKELSRLKLQNKYLQLQLGIIYNSKAFKLWQRFNRFKRIIIDHYFLSQANRIQKVIDILKTILYTNLFGQLFYIKFIIHETLNKHYEITLNSGSVPLVSILIPTYGSIYNIDRLIRSIFKFKSNVGIEVLICNDKPGAKQKIEKWCNKNNSLLKKTNVSVYSSKFNVGFSATINFLASRAKGDYLYLLNDDIEVISKGWISNLIENMKDPGVGITGSYLIFPNRYHIQHAGMHPFLKSDGKIYNYHFFKFFNHIFKDVKKREVPMVTGAALCVRKSLFFKVGGLNTRYLGAGGFDDSDLCNKIVKNGKKIIFCPKSKLVHYEGMTIRKAGRKHSIMFLYNQAYYQKKWLSFLKNKYPRFTVL